MNAVRNSILSPSFVPTLDAAAALYTAAQTEKERKQAAEAQAKENTFHAERQEVRAWLETQIPPEFVPYVDLSGYSHRLAERRIKYHGDSTDGFPARLEIPGAAPIRFAINYSNMYTPTTNEKFNFCAIDDGYDNLAIFSVPTGVRIEDTSDGDEEYDLCWSYPYSYTHNDFMLALGAAVALWREKGEPLMLELQRLEDRKIDETIEKMFDEDQEETESYDEPFDSLIARLILEATTLDLAKKRNKLDNKTDKFMSKLEKADADLAATFDDLLGREFEAIIYACFLSGLSYGLCPCPSEPIEDYITEAVAPIEKTNYIQWIAIETRIRQASPQLDAAYRKLDIAIARHKGIEQDAMFLHGMAIGQRLINAVSHQAEI